MFFISVSVFVFLQKGFGPEVPKYLQHEGKVKNRRFNVRDCNVLVHDIWKERQLQNAEQVMGNIHAQHISSLTVSWGRG